MQGRTSTAVLQSAEPPASETFAAWSTREFERLLRARAAETDPTARAQLELQLALICDAADRYGRLQDEFVDRSGA